MEHPHIESTNPKNHAMILRTHKELIMERWKERLCACIPAAKHQTRSELRNSIPKFLDRLAVALTDPEPKAVTFNDVNDISTHHGHQRATLARYSLSEMLNEYRLLREVIFETLELYWPLSRIHRDIILTSIEEGMVQAGCRFNEVAEEKESQQKEEYQNLLNSIKDHAIIRMDNHGIITDWNCGAENIIGYNREEMIGRSSSIIFTHEDKVKNAFIREFEIALMEGTASDERWHIKKDGKLFYAVASLNPIYDDQNHHIGFVKVIKDNTDIRFMEKELERSKAEFEAIYNSIPDTVVVTDQDRRVVACNPATLRFFGYSHEELIGKSAAIFYADEAEFKRLGKERYNILTPYHGTMSYPTRYKKKNGEIVIAETNASILRDEKGNVTGYLAIMRDITERVKAETVLREMADAMPQIVWSSDREGNIDYFNKRFFEYTGLEIEEALGQEWPKVVHPDDVNKVNALWKESLISGEPLQMDIRLKRHDNVYRWHLIRGFPVRSESGEIRKWYGTNTDIETQIKALNQLVEERDLRERFVSALSHDLRTPLTASKLSGQLIKRMYQSDEKLARSIDRVLVGIDRVDAMIQDLLDANRLSAGENIPIRPVACNLTSVIKQVLEDMIHIHGERFILNVEEAVEGFWDPISMRRVIENLCNNAVKYGDQDKKITVSLTKTGTQALIKVQNFGPVISPDEQKLLFMPYKRAAKDSAKKGWGIGLTLVRGMATAHKGFVSVESSETLGTIFTVTLPLDYQSV